MSNRYVWAIWKNNTLFSVYKTFQQAKSFREMVRIVDKENKYEIIQYRNPTRYT